MVPLVAPGKPGKCQRRPAPVQEHQAENCRGPDANAAGWNRPEWPRLGILGPVEDVVPDHAREVEATRGERNQERIANQKAPGRSRKHRRTDRRRQGDVRERGEDVRQSAAAGRRRANDRGSCEWIYRRRVRRPDLAPPRSRRSGASWPVFWCSHNGCREWFRRAAGRGLRASASRRGRSGSP